MRSNKLSPLLLLLLLSSLLLPACKSSKRGDGAKLRKKNSRVLLKKMESRLISAEWLNAKGRISYKGDDLSVRVSTNIRLRRDSAIWMNAKKLSIEAARVLITPDSIFILNRLHREYVAESFEYLARRYSLPASFSALQDILLGNPVLFDKNQEHHVSVEGEQYQLSTSRHDIHTDYWLDGFSYLLESMAFLDEPHDRKVVVDLTEYRPVEGVGKFSYVRNLKMKSPDTGSVNVEMKFSKIELDRPANMPFSIPSSYTRMAY